jgi:hypothetical protein
MTMIGGAVVMDPRFAIIDAGVEEVSAGDRFLADLDVGGLKD